ncbi:MAG: ATP-binding cassette domain-containing protein [Cyclobacteriaceae bacterium]
MKLIAHSLGKRFNREWVFRNFSYEFNSGKTYAIVGSNGSGKSTLMQVLWGQMHPSTGNVQYSVNDPALIYQSISIAAPYMDLIDEFTLEEMIQFHFNFKKPRIPIATLVEKMELNSAKQKSISLFHRGCGNA